MKSTKTSELNWYIVDTDYEMNVISAYTPSRAKVLYNNMWSMCTDQEALNEFTASKLKNTELVEPTKEWELYNDIFQLLELGIFKELWSQTECMNCNEFCDENNPQFFDKNTNKYYCNKCKK